MRSGYSRLPRATSSFKVAANELSITQAAVSHQIKSLGGVSRRRAVPPRGTRRAAHGSGARLPAETARGLRVARRRGGDDPNAPQETELLIHCATGVHRALADAGAWRILRSAEPRIELRVFGSSKMVDAGALDSGALVGNLDLRDDVSGVEIHLGGGTYPGYRADHLFDVATVAVASPELVRGDPPLEQPADLGAPNAPARRRHGPRGPR